MKIVIDMNLSPQWVAVFQNHGLTAIHWSTIGNPSAPDTEIMEWALNNAHVVFTHDLDFGAILSATQANAPSVIQVRTQDVTPSHLEPFVITALQQYEDSLDAGALIVIDESKLRVRLLPIQRN